ncbi:MAG: di-trans,poly-cis-decaprenylcistransferase [Bacteroidetes bacterium]|nr:di-trans,poly-cis-decaprenylcistransferase [Bacteroidota bacterium]MBU1718631.1 di-trans,poly-cis-decaprenylcistransferase [Bacteroidota bacterium]
MDGNGRWANQKGLLRAIGHQGGVEAVRDTVEGAAEIGVKYLTLYAFSTENWSRPKEEVDALMELLVQAINDETKTLNDNNIRLLAIGDIDALPEKCRNKLNETIHSTSENSRMTLILALSYSSKWEITRAFNLMLCDFKAGKLSGTIYPEIVDQYLTTAGIPDPDLLIRTSGEYRISNFLLWQIAYSELFFTETLWPDFRRQHLFEAIEDYQKRERRFGKTGDQINNSI